MATDLLKLNLTGPADEGPSPADRARVAGLVAGLASAAFAAALWWMLGTPLIPLRVADALFAALPITIVEIGTAFLGPYAKMLGFAGCLVAYLVILSLAAVLYIRRVPSPGWTSGLAFGALVWLAASLTVIPIAGGGLFGWRWGPAPWAAAATLFATGLVYGLALPAALGRLDRDEALARRGLDLASRRTLFGGIIAAGVLVVVGESARTVITFFGWGSNAKVRGGSGVFPDVDGLSREVTPTPDFYTISKNVFDPEGPPTGWALEIKGLVERPRVYTIEELRALPAAEGFATLACISNWVGGELIGNGLWRGVPLGDLLREAGVREGAVDLVFTALDDYTDSIPVERALQPGTLLAYEINGEPLPGKHGAPLRAVIPGIFGMKNVKWITSIELVATDYKGYWQRRGWDDRAEYQTMSRIDVARATRPGEPATIAGIAFAGDRGVSRVEVSTDGGATWGEAEVRPPLSPFTWVLWQFPWTPERGGDYTVVVRAVDGRGDVQTRRQAPPVPSGATGWHSVSLGVER
jgi:hypothetical protein